MRFEVPQFIEIEEKIFGPFTWRQAVYLGGGVGSAVALFLVTPFYIFLIIGLPILVLAAALSFFKVNTRPFSVLLESVYNYLRRSKLYLWKRSRGVVYRNDALPDPTLTRDPTKRDARETKSNLDSLARELELNALDKNE